MKTYRNLALLAILGSTSAWAERRIVVSLPDKKLALVVNGETLKVFNIAVGKSKTPSPIGTLTIVARVAHPTWYSPTHQIVAPGPRNPLGTRWIGLSRSGYGLHGTNAPWSIGRAVSRGCIRMRNSDVEELFRMVQEGDAVEFVSGRDGRVAKRAATTVSTKTKVSGKAKVAARQRRSEPVATPIITYVGDEWFQVSTGSVGVDTYNGSDASPAGRAGSGRDVSGMGANTR